MKHFLIAATVAATLGAAHADDFSSRHEHGREADFGEKIEELTRAHSMQLFGVVEPLQDSSSRQVTAAAANADPRRLVTLARGLTARVVSAAPTLGANVDQIVLWPNDSAPTHLIFCNEGNSSQPAVQRVEIATGEPQTIIASGLTSCDPIRRTPWGTVIVGEESGGGGRLFEILDPLATNGVKVTGSGAATASSDPAHVAFRPAVGTLSWEGLALLPNGVMYMADESRPGNGIPGGGLFKFIPDALWTGAAPIASLAASPLAGGRLFGWRAGRNGNNTDFGQGNEFGRGVWVEVTNRGDVGGAPINLRTAGQTLRMTAYYRPEDAALDERELRLGKVRFCGTNTGQDVPATSSNGDNHWGEVYCFRDGTVEAAGSIVTGLQTVSGVSYTLNTATVPEYQPLVIGNVDFAMMDNIAYQPGRGNWVLNEDGEGPTYETARNNDIWACLDDGGDSDELSDGCIRVISLNDLTAESTGGVFDASGTRYFVSIQHNITGHGVILEIDGWR